MPNPYAPPSITADDETNFRLRETVHSAGGAIRVGLFCGTVGGIALEFGMRRYPGLSIMWQMAVPGLVFGMGVTYAAWKAVPNARKLMLALFPFVALVAFLVIGMLFDRPTPGWPNINFYSWLILTASAIPGVLILALGCLLVARPRSYFRFAVFTLATVVGGRKLRL